MTNLKNIFGTILDISDEDKHLLYVWLSNILQMKQSKTICDEVVKTLNEKENKQAETSPNDDELKDFTRSIKQPPTQQPRSSQSFDRSRQPLLSKPVNRSVIEEDEDTYDRLGLG